MDQQIRMAQERGEFDDLPGMGKPLPGRGTQDDELWWLRSYLHLRAPSGPPVPVRPFDVEAVVDQWRSCR